MTTDKRSTRHNTRLAQWGLTCKIEGSCFYLAFVQVDSLVPRWRASMTRANGIVF